MSRILPFDNSCSNVITSKDSNLFDSFETEVKNFISANQVSGDNSLNVSDFIDMVNENFGQLFNAFKYEIIKKEFSRLFYTEKYSVDINMAYYNNHYTIFIDVMDGSSSVYHAEVKLNDDDTLSIERIPYNKPFGFYSSFDRLLSSLAPQLLERLTIYRDYSNKFGIPKISNEPFFKHSFCSNGEVICVWLFPDGPKVIISIAEFLEKLKKNYAFDINKEEISFPFYRIINNYGTDIMKCIPIDLNDFTEEERRIIGISNGYVKKNCQKIDC